MHLPEDMQLPLCGAFTHLDAVPERICTTLIMLSVFSRTEIVIDTSVATWLGEDGAYAREVSLRIPAPSGPTVRMR